MFKFQTATINFIVISWFLSMFLVPIYLYKSALSIDNAFHLAVAIGAVALVVMTLVVGWQEMKEELKPMLFITFGGIAPLALGILLAINFHLRGEPYEEVYEVKYVYLEMQDGVPRKRVQLAGNQYEYFPHLLGWDEYYYTDLEQADYVRVFASEGLFGIKVIEGTELIQ